jgi:N-acetylmuramoyl-L-alanine amidase
MANANDYLIAGDDGHGMYNQTGSAENPGKRTPIFPDGHYTLEDEFNKSACNYFLSACQRCGFRTIQLAPEDTNTSLSTRTNRANIAGANASLSWHFDA